jgi:hypothetical protein
MMAPAAAIAHPSLWPTSLCRLQNPSSKSNRLHDFLQMLFFVTSPISAPSFFSASSSSLRTKRAMYSSW